MVDISIIAPSAHHVDYMNRKAGGYPFTDGYTLDAWTLARRQGSGPGKL